MAMAAKFARNAISALPSGTKSPLTSCMRQMMTDLPDSRRFCPRPGKEAKGRGAGHAAVYMYLWKWESPAFDGKFGRRARDGCTRFISQ